MKANRRPPHLLRHLTPIAATALVLLILLATTLPLLQWWTHEGAAALLENNRELWDSHGISSYDLSLERQCDCAAAGRYRITVRTDNAIAAVDDGGNEVPLASLPSTIEAVFDEVERRIVANPDDVSVDYDGIYGFPRRLDADPNSALSGEQATLVVTSFRPVGAARGSNVE